jgi:hypothetical protein
MPAAPIVPRPVGDTVAAKAKLFAGEFLLARQLENASWMLKGRKCSVAALRQILP